MNHLCALSSSYHFSLSKIHLCRNTCYYDGFNGIIIRNIPLSTRTKYPYLHKWSILAIEGESKFEIDEDKARQALTQLDQQLESLSTKQVKPPKTKASSFSNIKELRNEPPEISGSYLGYTAFILFAFTILYNIIFLTVIKPSIDGPDEDTIATNITTIYQYPNVSQMQQ